MHLIDTNVISERRKGTRADAGVQRFFANSSGLPLFLSAITVGELRRGVELIRHRGDASQAERLAAWLETLVDEFRDCILPFDADAAQVWGRLMAPQTENALDKQIAAIALIHDLTVVTRNVTHFQAAGLTVVNPFDDR